MNSSPQISIITGTYNSEKHVRDCIQSVHNQDYKQIEHIIIDGASKDNTVAIIKEMPNSVSTLISEKDKGIYNAMNKGLKLAQGEILGILNSDDFYIDHTILSKVANRFEKTGADCVFGNLYYVDAEDTDKIVRKWVTGPFVPGAFKKGWHPAHPSFFVRRKVYEKFGYFNEELNLAADFELMLRFLEKHKITWDYIDQPLVKMRLGGATSSGIKNMLKGNKECLKAFALNNINAGTLYPFKRLVPKLKQYL